MSCVFLSCSPSALVLISWTSEGFVRAGLLDRPVVTTAVKYLRLSACTGQRRVAIFCHGCVDLSQLWLPGQKYLESSGQPMCADVAGDTNVDIRNNETALSGFSCSNTSPDASAFLQGGMHTCRCLMDPMHAGSVVKF